jgi:hypothetical protein
VSRQDERCDRCQCYPNQSSLKSEFYENQDFYLCKRCSAIVVECFFNVVHLLHNKSIVKRDIYALLNNLMLPCDAFKEQYK